MLYLQTIAISRLIDSTFIENKAMEDGGAICIYGVEYYYIPRVITGAKASLILNGMDNVFTGNIAGEDGGAILAFYYCIILQNGKILFEGNKADNNGGAIYTEDIA